MGILDITKNRETLIKIGTLNHQQLTLLAYGLYRAGEKTGEITEKDLDDMIALAKKHAK